MVAHEKNSSPDKQGNEKDFQQINKEMKNFIDKNLIKALLLPNGRGFHKNGRGAKKFSCPPHCLRAGAASGSLRRGCYRSLI